MTILFALLMISNLIIVVITYHLKISDKRYISLSTRLNDVQNPRQKLLRNFRHNSLIAASILPTLFPLKINAVEKLYLDTQAYFDEINKFKINTYPGWKIISKISPSEKAMFSLNPNSVIYKPQEILFSASNFVEGATLTVIKTDARKLLQNADIEWWFGPLNELNELGTPELIGELLGLQREDQLKDSNPYQISSSGSSSNYNNKRKFNDYQNEELKEFELNESKYDYPNQCIYFSYNTSVANYVTDFTLAKGYFRQGKFVVLFVRALGSVFNGDYGQTLKNIYNSFEIFY
jgi:hypothetical protein